MCLLHIYLSMYNFLDRLAMDHNVPILHLDWLCSTKVLELYHHLMGFCKSCDRRELHEMLKSHSNVVIEHPIFDRCDHSLFSFGILGIHYLVDLSLFHHKSTILVFLLSIMTRSMFFGFEEQYKSQMLMMVRQCQLPCSNWMMMLKIERTQI
jgi:hypothetical protein